MQVLPVTGDPMTMRVMHVSSHFVCMSPALASSVLGLVYIKLTL